MPIKCKSDQIFTERYQYSMQATENIFLPVKARRNEVLIVHSLSLYNPTQNGFTHCYEVMRRRGAIYRLDYVAALATVTVHKFVTEIYLIDGDEAGIILTPSTTGDIVELTMQGMLFRDDEYFKST